MSSLPTPRAGPACAPSRLSVFLARSAAVGVVLRRGPSEWAQLVHWDRGRDVFTPGQWFHGRVYGRRCDLSPDGELFVYFAAKHGPRAERYDIGEAWTAISRPPYFTAWTLWPNLGSWYGGGTFTADRRLLLDASCGGEPHVDFLRPGLEVQPMPADTAPWEQRLVRDGWTLVERGFEPRRYRRVGKREIWEKRSSGRSPVTLCRELQDVDFTRYGGPYHETFWLEGRHDLQPLEGVTWAEWEREDRLVFAREGCLYAATLVGLEPCAVKLFDFNPGAPQNVATPAWAQPPRR